MKKLLQATSAIAVILMSSQAYASNQEMDDVEKAKITRTLIGQNKTDQQIADYFEMQKLINTSSTSVTPSVASSAVANPVKEEVKYAAVTMNDLRNGDLNAKYMTMFTQVHKMIHAATGVGNRKYGLIEELNNKKSGDRKFRPESWDSYQKSFAHDTPDVNIVAGPQQAYLIKCIFYKKFLEDNKLEITELKSVGSVEPKGVQELVNSMTNRNQEKNLAQTVVNTAMSKKFF